MSLGWNFLTSNKNTHWTYCTLRIDRNKRIDNSFNWKIAIYDASKLSADSRVAKRQWCFCAIVFAPHRFCFCSYYYYHYYYFICKRRSLVSCVRKKIRVNETMLSKVEKKCNENIPKQPNKVATLPWILPVFSSNVFVVLGRLIMMISSLSTNGIYGRVPSPKQTKYTRIMKWDQSMLWFSWAD